jgi:peptide deformylase
MDLLEIKVYPAAVLKQRAAPITNIDDRIRELAQAMLDTMYRAPGVGLAAPQVGESIRLLVADPGSREEPEPIVLVNPQITAAEGKTAMQEGCLSVPGFTAEVDRHKRIIVKGWTLDEQEVELELVDFPAILLQHEIDHLEGTLFIDRISRLKRNIYERKRKKGTLPED